MFHIDAWLERFLVVYNRLCYVKFSKIANFLFLFSFFYFYSSLKLFKSTTVNIFHSVVMGIWHHYQCRPWDHVNSKILFANHLPLLVSLLLLKILIHTDLNKKGWTGRGILLVFFLGCVMWVRSSFYFSIFTPFVQVTLAGKLSISLWKNTFPFGVCSLHRILCITVLLPRITHA